MISRNYPNASVCNNRGHINGAGYLKTNTCREIEKEQDSRIKLEFNCI